MDIFEYNEVRWPTRALQQEEEEQAVAGADDNLIPPEIQWSQGFAPPDKSSLLVVAMSPASTALLTAAMGPDRQVIGHVSVSSCQQTERSSDKASQPAALYSLQPDVIVCCCSAPVAPEHAGAWARDVLGQLKPQRVLLLGSMQAEQYRGEADASQELLAFVMRSTTLRQQQEQQPAPVSEQLPYLPSGSIVSGLPAALLSQAELADMSAELLVVVEQVPSLVPETLQQLGRLVAVALQKALPAQGQPGDKQWAESLAAGPVVDAARVKLQRTVYRPSSVYS